MVKEYWMVNTSQGLVHTDKDGRIWWGGSPSLVFVPIFADRKEAQRFRTRATKVLKKKFKVRWF